MCIAELEASRRVVGVGVRAPFALGATVTLKEMASCELVGLGVGDCVGV